MSLIQPLKSYPKQSERGSVAIILVLVITALLLFSYERMDYNTRQASKLTIDKWLNQQIEDSWVSEVRMALSDGETCLTILNSYFTTNTLPSSLFTISKIRISSIRVVDDTTPRVIQNATVKNLEINWSRTDSQSEIPRLQRFPFLAEGSTPGLVSCRGTWLVETQIIEEYICKLFGKVYHYGSTPSTEYCVTAP